MLPEPGLPLPPEAQQALQQPEPEPVPRQQPLVLGLGQPAMELELAHLHHGVAKELEGHPATLRAPPPFVISDPAF